MYDFHFGDKKHITGGNPMTTIEMQQQIQSTIATFPEHKLKGVLEFVNYLAEYDLPEGFQMQLSSTAYQEWLSEEIELEHEDQ